MSVDPAVRLWRDTGKYLPPAMRDFHDQKDIFKMIHGTTNVEGHEYCRDISWVAGQCYVVDIFLWAMARYGYTLQRSRTRLPFEDINAAVATAKGVET